MKTIILCIILTASFAQPAFGAIVVHDPLNTEVLIENGLAEIAKLLALIDQVRTSKEWMGNPTDVIVIVAPELAQGLEQPGVARSRTDIAAASTSAEAASYDGNGRFTPIGDSFRTQDGRMVQRADEYKPEAAIFNAVADHDAVYEDVLARRNNLRAALSRSLSQLQNATTHAEVLKVSGAITAQLAELEATDHELLFSAQKAQLLDIENRADQERQRKATEEELAQEFSLGLKKLGGILEIPNFTRASAQ